MVAVLPTGGRVHWLADEGAGDPVGVEPPHLDVVDSTRHARVGAGEVTKSPVGTISMVLTGHGGRMMRRPRTPAMA